MQIPLSLYYHEVSFLEILMFIRSSPKYVSDSIMVPGLTKACDA
jgi:hypothetical protein